MKRFGNLKVGSVLGFFYPKTAVLIFGLKKKKKKFNFFCWKLNIEVAVSVFDLGLEAKTGCLCLLVCNMTTSYYVLVGTNTMFVQTQKNKSKNRLV